ncbi:MAG: branched-chain amino acid ABC transporter permease [Anaerovoracaceae bacterium]|jgi:branched-chain amino acid transport system permease protein|nr:branched-chain amino acid ABC transporter permease [Clostridiales bacterium]
MRALTKKNLMILGSILLTFIIVQALLLVGILDSFHEITISTICINIILAVSLNLVTGFTGQLSLGHAGFMSIGAYVCALISMRMMSTQGFLIGVLTGALVAAFIGILIGIPTLRLKGDYLAIATLGMAEIIRVVFLNLEITNGAAGLNGIPRFTNWLWLYFFTVTAVVLINNFIKSSHGRACIAIREDEIAAESMGINTTKYKVIVFAISAFFGGLAGGLYSSYFYFLKPDLFGFMKSVDILVIVVLGGLGSVTGSIIAAILLGLITTFLQSFTAVRMIVYAVLLVLIMIFRPSGIMGSKEINDLFKFRFGKKEERIE